MSRTRTIILMACLVLAGCETVPDPSPPAASEGISRIAAIKAAREAASGVVEGPWQVTAVAAGPLGGLVPEFETYEWARGLSTDLRVWRVGLVSGDVSALVVTDFVDGAVYGVVVGVAN